jgi:mannitol/fructose-specific phosphotransferase system IIA component (Ntr-type)
LPTKQNAEEKEVLLSEIFNIQHIKLNLESETKDEAFRELVETISAQHPELNRQEMLEAITTRENQMNTAIAPGVAMPHGYCRSFNGIVGVIGISEAGIEYDEEEHEIAHCIFMVLMGRAASKEHLGILSKLSNLLNSKELSKIRSAKCAQEVHDILCRFEQSDLRGLT